MEDKIIIHDAKFETIIGIDDEEREHPRALHLDVALFTDITNAARKDHIDATISYTHVHTRLKKLIETTQWDLIEAVAEESAQCILREFPISKVFVRVRKPSALTQRGVAYTAVEITRTA